MGLKVQSHISVGTTTCKRLLLHDRYAKIVHSPKYLGRQSILQVVLRHIALAWKPRLVKSE